MMTQQLLNSKPFCGRVTPLGRGNGTRVAAAAGTKQLKKAIKPLKKQAKKVSVAPASKKGGRFQNDGIPYCCC